MSTGYATSYTTEMMEIDLQNLVFQVLDCVDYRGVDSRDTSEVVHDFLSGINASDPGRAALLIGYAWSIYPPEELEEVTTKEHKKQGFGVDISYMALMAKNVANAVLSGDSRHVKDEDFRVEDYVAYHYGYCRDFMIRAIEPWLSRERLPPTPINDSREIEEANKRRIAENTGSLRYLLDELDSLTAYDDLPPVQTVSPPPSGKRTKKGSTHRPNPDYPMDEDPVWYKYRRPEGHVRSDDSDMLALLNTLADEYTKIVNQLGGKTRTNEELIASRMIDKCEGIITTFGIPKMHDLLDYAHTMLGEHTEVMNDELITLLIALDAYSTSNPVDHEYQYPEKDSMRFFIVLNMTIAAEIWARIREDVRKHEAKIAEYREMERQQMEEQKSFAATYAQRKDAEVQYAKSSAVDTRYLLSLLDELAVLPDD